MHCAQSYADDPLNLIKCYRCISDREVVQVVLYSLINYLCCRWLNPHPLSIDHSHTIIVVRKPVGVYSYNTDNSSLHATPSEKARFGVFIGRG